jgi:hypothetical protein
VADARPPGEFAQRELEALGFAKDFQGCLDDRAAQIAVVIGAFFGLGRVVCTENLNPNILVMKSAKGRA